MNKLDPISDAGDRLRRSRERSEERTSQSLNRILAERTEALKAAIDYFALVDDMREEAPSTLKIVDTADVFEAYLRGGEAEAFRIVASQTDRSAFLTRAKSNTIHDGPSIDGVTFNPTSPLEGE